MYLKEVEKHFCRKRGKSLILSPRDWLLIKQWFEDGIPLTTVLQGIDLTFTNSVNPKRINSISYCEQEIHSLWETYKENLVGSNRKKAQVKEKNVFSFTMDRIDEITHKLHKNTGKEPKSIISKKVLSFFENLKKELSGNKKITFIKAEKKFNHNREIIVQYLQDQLGEKGIREIDKKIGEELKSYQKKMSSKTYKETRTYLFQKKILMKFNLTNISLYD